jgi:O-antigen/teichoic acid export membrane protein
MILLTKLQGMPSICLLFLSYGKLFKTFFAIDISTEKVIHNLDSDKSDSDSGEPNESKIHSSSDFVTPGFLFLDSLLISIAGWIYWLVISKLTSASELGLAVTVYSLILLVTTLIQLGLEYPLLKKTNTTTSHMLGTSFVIELVLTLASIPFIFLVINTVYDAAVEQYMWISILLLIILSLEFVFRFALLGISNSKIVLFIDLIGVVIKLSTGFTLVHFWTGSLGILLAYLFEGFFVIFASFYFVIKSMSFKVGNLEYFRETIRDAVINTPAKYSKMVVVILSVVLLSFLNISPSDIGIFYVALMITIVVASFASSMAYMVIPTSAILKKDLSSTSLRISLALTSPIVVVLLVVPKSILSLINPEYVSADLILFILALGIIPSSITITLISKLNNLNRAKMLILTGVLQVVVFFISFLSVVPQYGTVGAALSILITYLASSIILIIMTKYDSIRYVLFSYLSVFIGFIAGYTLNTLIGQHQVFIIIFSVATSIVVILVSKSLTIKETKVLVNGIFKKQ